MNCKSCGAGCDSHRLTCAFCGSALMDGMQEDQELEALQELRQAAAQLSPDKQAKFWRNAFIPQSWRAGSQAFAECIQGVDNDSQVSRAMFARSEALYTSVTLKHMMEPLMLTAAPLMKEHLEKARERAHASEIALEKEQKAEAESEARQNKLTMVIVIVAFPSIAFIFWALTRS